MYCANPLSIKDQVDSVIFLTSVFNASKTGFNGIKMVFGVSSKGLLVKT